MNLRRHVRHGRRALAESVPELRQRAPRNSRGTAASGHAATFEEEAGTNSQEAFWATGMADGR
eukprot:3381596-Prymnesium_polylepis.1